MRWGEYVKYRIIVHACLRKIARVSRSPKSSEPAEQKSNRIQLRAERSGELLNPYTPHHVWIKRLHSSLSSCLQWIAKTDRRSSSLVHSRRVARARVNFETTH